MQKPFIFVLRGLRKQLARYKMKSIALRQSPCMMQVFVIKLSPVSSLICTLISGKFVILHLAASISSSSLNKVIRLTVSNDFDMTRSSRCSVISFDNIAFSASIFTANTCSVVLRPGSILFDSILKALHNIYIYIYIYIYLYISLHVIYNWPHRFTFQ